MTHASGRKLKMSPEIGLIFEAAGTREIGKAVRVAVENHRGLQGLGLAQIMRGGWSLSTPCAGVNAAAAAL